MIPNDTEILMIFVIAGSHLGGMLLTINGNSLTSRAVVTIDGQPCTDLQGTLTAMTCITPPSSKHKHDMKLEYETQMP